MVDQRTRTIARAVVEGGIGKESAGGVYLCLCSQDSVLVLFALEMNSTPTTAAERTGPPDDEAEQDPRTNEVLHEGTNTALLRS